MMLRYSYLEAEQSALAALEVSLAVIHLGPVAVHTEGHIDQAADVAPTALQPQIDNAIESMGSKVIKLGQFQSPLQLCTQLIPHIFSHL